MLTDLGVDKTTAEVNVTAAVAAIVAARDMRPIPEHP